LCEFCVVGVVFGVTGDDFSVLAVNIAGVGVINICDDGGVVNILVYLVFLLFGLSFSLPLASVVV
jgi:hypothetical protein